MSDERRKYPRFSVNWRARILFADKSIYPAKVIDVSQGGVGVEFYRVEAVGTKISVEFMARVRDTVMRVRAKTVVSFNTVLSENRGAHIGLKFVEIDKQIHHDLCNIIQRLADGS